MINYSCPRIVIPGEMKDFPQNLDIIYTDKAKTHFDTNYKKVRLRTTVHNKNFHVKGVYHYTDKAFSLILCHITDNSTNPSKPEPQTHILNIDFDFSDLQRLGNCSGNFTGTHQIVNVIMYNDDGNFNIDKRPRESGGGVIVEGP